MNYEPPKVEQVIKAKDLQREALYAGGISKGPG
jgi:hypothetical protein